MAAGEATQRVFRLPQEATFGLAAEAEQALHLAAERSRQAIRQEAARHLDNRLGGTSGDAGMLGDGAGDLVQVGRLGKLGSGGGLPTEQAVNLASQAAWELVLQEAADHLDTGVGLVWGDAGALDDLLD